MVDDGVILKYADRSQDLRSGDTIVTSGLDGIFPRGLLVGTIQSVRRDGAGTLPWREDRAGGRFSRARASADRDPATAASRRPGGQGLTRLRLILLFAVFVILGLAFESAGARIISVRSLIPNLIIILAVDLGLRHHGVVPAILAFTMGYATDAIAGSHRA